MSPLSERAPRVNIKTQRAINKVAGNKAHRDYEPTQVMQPFEDQTKTDASHVYPDIVANGVISTTALQQTSDTPLAASTENIHGNHARADSREFDASGLGLVSYTIPQLLFDQARSSPDAPAIDSYECQWSYAVLVQKVDLATTLFAKRGIRPGQKVRGVSTCHPGQWSQCWPS